jgi:hypothetical protein
MFNWLKRTTPATTQTITPQSSAPATDLTRSMKEVFASAEDLANWVGDFVIDKATWRGDFSLLPDEAAQRDLNITFAQKDRCVKEYSVLRLAGMVLYVRQQFDNAYSERFLSIVTTRLASDHGATTQADVLTLGQALDDYVKKCMQEDENDVGLQYMKRVYDDNDNFLRMRVAGIGTIALGFIETGFSVLRNVHYEAITGMSYDTHVALDKAAKLAKGSEA